MKPMWTDELRSFWSMDSFDSAKHERVTVPPAPAAWNDEHQAAALDALLSGILVRPRDKILDYGCGVGRVCRALLKRGALVYAVDVSPRMLEYTREYCAGLAGLQTLLTCGWGAPEIATASTDGAISVYCFQHMPTLDMAVAVLQDVYRVLKPGGWFILQSTDHYFEGMPREAGFLGARQKIAMVMQLASEAGFETERVVCPLNANENVHQYLLTLRKPR